MEMPSSPKTNLCIFHQKKKNYNVVCAEYIRKEKVEPRVALLALKAADPVHQRSHQSLYLMAPLGSTLPMCINSSAFAFFTAHGKLRRGRLLHTGPFCSSPREPAATDQQQQRQRQEGRGDGDEDDVFGLPAGLQRDLLPKHVAVVMDGNSRWARSLGLPASAGHLAGVKSLKEMAKLSCKWGISALTVFAFSAENWSRPTPAVDFLLMLFENMIKKNVEEFRRLGIRMCTIGDTSKLPKRLQKVMVEADERTRDSSRMDLIMAISYSGRSDIVQACQRIAHKVKQGALEPTEVTESLISQELETHSLTKFHFPDLLIRTSGELRLSNFMLWQSAYTELYFAEAHWPDFGEADYVEALSSFQRRQRRFGRRV